MLPQKLTNKINSALDSIRANDLFRSINSLDFTDAGHALDSTGKKYLVLASNNYLGLTFQPEVLAAGRQAFDHGSGSTGARLTTGACSQLQLLEEHLAKFKQTEAALLYNTGYMANVGVISTLAEPGDIIFSDELNHASIIDGARLSKAQIVVYKHSDMCDLQLKLQNIAKPTANIFIITDGVFSMDGDIAKLPDLVYLSKQYNACLIVDDAHAVGVLGTRGSGTAEHFNLCGQVDVQIGTLSKALAGEGGYVAANRLLINYLINKSRSFIFSTACSPVNAAVVSAALDYLMNTPSVLTKLHENSQVMSMELRRAELPVLPSSTPIIPILIGDAGLAMEFSRRLYEQGIILTAIRPPTVEHGKSRLRLTVTAAHDKQELINAAQTICKLYKQLCLD